MAYAVVDTHIFNRSLSQRAEYREVMDTIIRVCDRIVISPPIQREYMERSSDAGIDVALVLRVIQGQELLALGKIHKVASHSVKRALKGIPEQDQRFIEAARASNAKYIISNDPDFHSQRRRLRRHRISVVYPDKYVHSH
jgi:predicted nucleic acid-binding protein